jgi:antirestriction protein
MTTIHAGDRTSGCEECTKNDYINEIITENNYESNADTMVGALEAWVSNSPTYFLWENWGDWIADFEEAYQGEWTDEQEFADQIANDAIAGDSATAQLYFDYQSFARDLFMGDYWSSNGYIFRSI